MKRFGLIIASSLVVLVGAGSGYVLASRRGASPESTVARMQGARSVLMGEASPVTRLAPPIGDELMDPDRTLPFFHRFALEELSRVHRLAESCDRALDLPAANVELEKARRFASYLCGHTAGLSDDFFASPPYMHPTGKSYVSLARESGHPSFQGQGWLDAHLGRMHVLERPEQGILAGMTRDDLAALWRGDAIVLTIHHALLFAHRSSGRGDGGEYLVYPRALWDSQLAAREVDPMVLSALLIVALTAVLVLTATLIVFAVVRLNEKRRERADQMFVVRALTHELRTPATSLNLTLEALRTDFDRLPEASQEAFLLLTEQVQRLNRVIEGTTRYLKTDDAKLSPSHLKVLPSVQSFFESVLEPYQNRIVVETLPGDRPFAIDPYLLKVCVQNLVENALRHGKPEVRVRVSFDKGQLDVQIQDQGTLPETDPTKLSAAAAYGSGHGLGLGLHLVTKIVKDLGGSLSLARFPATFSLRFKEVL